MKLVNATPSDTVLLEESSEGKKKQKLTCKFTTTSIPARLMWFLDVWKEQRVRNLVKVETTF